MDEIVTLFVNNGVAVGLLAYFVYRDNKFMNTLASSLTSLQMSIDSLKKLLEGDKNDSRGNENTI